MNKMRKGIVKYKDTIAGIIEETDNGFRFTYDDDFLKRGIAISFSISAKQKIHESKELFIFFAEIPTINIFKNKIKVKITITIFIKFFKLFIDVLPQINFFFIMDYLLIF